MYYYGVDSGENNTFTACTEDVFSTDANSK